MKTTSTFLGVQEHTAIAIGYALGWVSGLVILLAEKNNDKVRYHAAQSIIVFGSITLLNLIISTVPFWGASLLLLNILSITTIVAWIVFVVAALNKKPMTLNAISGYVDQLQSLIKAQ